MRAFGRAGIAPVDGGPGFAPVTSRAVGNGPGLTGTPSPSFGPGPHPAGQQLSGQLGGYDGTTGTDPRSPGGQLPAYPRRVVMGAEQETTRRYGVQGFNDRLAVHDRHVYWSRGHLRSGTSRSVPGTPPNPDTDGPAMPTLRAINVSINPQGGSDNTANQDDRSRPYTWLGQQDGSAQPIYGGVPGLWASYGNRGLPSGIHDPSNGQGGPGMVYSGPPHGLHSDTLPSGKQTSDRSKVTPQMRPVRLDRPDNSRAAGQSFSQTVQHQGKSGPGGGSTPRGGATASVSLRLGGRGWGGK